MVALSIGVAALLSVSGCGAAAHANDTQSLGDLRLGVAMGMIGGAFRMSAAVCNHINMWGQKWERHLKQGATPSRPTA